MVCSKCAKFVTGTALATPGVKKKSEMYYGSSASSSAGGSGSTKKPATLGQTGIGKVCDEQSLKSVTAKMFSLTCNRAN